MNPDVARDRPVFMLTEAAEAAPPVGK